MAGLRISRSKRVTYDIKVTIETSCLMDFSDYPFDDHVCNFQVISWRRNKYAIYAYTHGPVTGLALVDSLHKPWLLLASIGHGAKGPPSLQLLLPYSANVNLTAAYRRWPWEKWPVTRYCQHFTVWPLLTMRIDYTAFIEREQVA